MSELNQGEVEVPSAELILDLPDWMGTSYSQLQTYRACPQRWYYSYRLGLRKPDTETQHMDFGSWWHLLRACDSVERGRALGSLRQVPPHLGVPDGTKLEVDVPGNLVERFWEVLGAWWEKLPPVEAEVWTGIYGEPVPDRLRALNEAWWREHGDDILLEEPLAVELWWTRTIQVKVGDHEIDLRLGGYIDEIYWDQRRRMTVVRDHKTGGALSTQTAVDDMTDSQLQLYGWGVYPLVETWKLPAKGVGAVAYDRVRTAKPKTPKLNLDGTLSKSITDFDAHTYIEWAKEGVPFEGRKKDGAGAGIYELDPSVVDSLSTQSARSKWFQRTLTPLNRNVLRAHLQSAVDTVRDQVNTRARIEVSREAPRNLGKSCKYCDFTELCRAEMLGGPMEDIPLEDFNLVKREKKSRP